MRKHFPQRLADAALEPPPEGGRGVVDEGPPATLSEPAPWELLHPLAAGSVVGYGWRVAGLTGVVDGSSVLTLENERGQVLDKKG